MSERSTRFSNIDSPHRLRALPEEDLPGLCAELRDELIALCGQVGGHLGASLGAVELVVALHRVFKSPRDKLVFDVGHQAYAHKLVTGRRERMATLRQADGIAPFLDPRESEHDAFAAGHACTAVSVSLGLLAGRALKQDEGRVVAILGDGALTGGLTFEGLNHAGALKLPLMVVLNDNQMSISPNVGAVANMLPTVSARMFFEALGYAYWGPVDGHDLKALIPALTEAKRSQGPVVLHVRTQKGKGFRFAEEDTKTRGHAMGPYELRAGKLVRARGGQTTYSERFAAELLSRMEKDPRIVVVTPAMIEGSGLGAIAARFPKRLFDVGIAEQHAVTFCAGLAAAGMKPVCCIYSTFLQRAYDSVVHDVCLPGLPVIFAVDRAGLVGADGATHQGMWDLSFLSPLPNLTLVSPVFGEDLGPGLDTALKSTGPFVLRFPRATEPALPEALKSSPAQHGINARWFHRAPNPEVVVVALGPLALTAWKAAQEETGWAVMDARALVPLDTDALQTCASAKLIVTLEEASTTGGLGAAVTGFFAAERFSERAPRVLTLGLPRQPLAHGDARAQRQALGLSVEGIRTAIKTALEASR